MNKNKAIERLGKEKLNNQGYLMKVVEYVDSNNVIVEFQDEYRTRVRCQWHNFQNGGIYNPSQFKQRLGEERYNYQKCLMKIIEYPNANNIVVEFQDEYKVKVNSRYSIFEKGEIKNPYCPSVYDVGIVGNKYPVMENGKNIKEHKIWRSMLQRCFDKKLKEQYPTYKDATCCKEWLLYENFYEWLHSQNNFNKWLNGNRWCLDKDILTKGNKIYSPETCCLVPPNVNNLFVKNNAVRGVLPIGVLSYKNRFKVYCCSPFTSKNVYIGSYLTQDEAFNAYKQTKESYIKQVAQIEYNNDNITKQCYEAMMNYIVEITD